MIFLLSHIVYAANWLMIQGTEKSWGHHLWGFYQVKAEHNRGKIRSVNGYDKTPFSYIRPTLKNQQELQLSRARLGLRGAFDDENRVNYFLLTEFAHNGVNNPLGYYHPSYLIDASITLKQLPIFIRFGKFKYAGSEEGNMARFVSPFINFSTVGSQLMLERFVTTSVSEPKQGVGAFRDSGVQLFNEFFFNTKSSLTFSYMLGNGSGTANKNINNNNFTHYMYVSFESLLGTGKGYYQESYKLYFWLHSGKRMLEQALYERERYGAGFTYFDNGLRLEAEYMAGSGMIFSGAQDSDNRDTNNVWMYKMHADASNKADGYYALATYNIFDSLDILARYDVYNRLTNDITAFRRFETITTGLSYRFTKFSRIDLNYDYNKLKAPNNKSANAFLLEHVGDLLSIQFTMVIK